MKNKLLKFLALACACATFSTFCVACDIVVNPPSSSSSSFSSVDETSSEDSSIEETSSEDSSGIDYGGMTDEEYNAIATQGLEYTYLEEENAYEVAGIGTATETDIIIPRTHEGLPVISIGERAFLPSRLEVSPITRVVISDSVQSIGASAFSSCFNLISVVIGENVQRIGDWAFSSCFNLTSIEIPDSVQSIGESAFRGCFNLTSVVIGENVQSIGSWAFGWCSNLTSVVIGDSVQSIGHYAFISCINLTNVVIGDNVQSIGASAFAGCYNLASIVIPDSVENIGDGAFYGCSKLVEVVNKSPHITVTKDDNSGLGEYALAVFNSTDTYVNKFTNDNGYIVYTNGEEKVLVNYVGEEKYLTVPDYITEIYDHAFYGCNSIVSVVIGDNVTKIGTNIFYYNHNLVSVVIGSGVKSIEHMYCLDVYKLVEIINKSPYITIPEDSKLGDEIQHNALAVYNSDSGITESQLINDNGYLIHDDGTDKILVGYVGEENRLILPDYITKIYQFAFLGTCYQYFVGNACAINGRVIKDVVIPKGVTDIGYGAFGPGVLGIEYAGIENVYYTGTASDWEDIGIHDMDNGDLTEATRYYYIENEADVPDDGGNYWHWVDGEATAW